MNKSNPYQHKHTERDNVSKVAVQPIDKTFQRLFSHLQNLKTTETNIESANQGNFLRLRLHSEAKRELNSTNQDSDAAKLIFGSELEAMLSVFGLAFPTTEATMKGGTAASSNEANNSRQSTENVSTHDRKVTINCEPDNLSDAHQIPELCTEFFSSFQLQMQDFLRNLMDCLKFLKENSAHSEALELSLLKNCYDRQVLPFIKHSILVSSEPDMHPLHWSEHLRKRLNVSAKSRNLASQFEKYETRNGKSSSKHNNSNHDDCDDYFFDDDSGDPMDDNLYLSGDSSNGNSEGDYEDDFGDYDEDDLEAELEEEDEFAESLLISKLARLRQAVAPYANYYFASEGCWRFVPPTKPSWGATDIAHSEYASLSLFNALFEKLLGAVAGIASPLEFAGQLRECTTTHLPSSIHFHVSASLPQLKRLQVLQTNPGFGFDSPKGAKELKIAQSVAMKFTKLLRYCSTDSRDEQEFSSKFFELKKEAFPLLHKLIDQSMVVSTSEDVFRTQLEKLVTLNLFLKVAIVFLQSSQAALPPRNRKNTTFKEHLSKMAESLESAQRKFDSKEYENLLKKLVSAQKATAETVTKVQAEFRASTVHNLSEFFWQELPELSLIMLNLVRVDALQNRENPKEKSLFYVLGEATLAAVLSERALCAEQRHGAQASL